jgi:hypothetical protein
MQVDLGQQIPMGAEGDSKFEIVNITFWWCDMCWRFLDKSRFMVAVIVSYFLYNPLSLMHATAYHSELQTSIISNFV